MATWTSPDGTHRHRIDYVAVPQNWSASCAHSSVIQDFDRGNAHEDHQAVGLELCWHGVAETEPRRATGASFHRAAIGPNCNRIACAKIKPASWSTDIETQAQQLNTQLLQQVCLACPVYPAAPKKRCLNGAVWALRAQKLALRKRIKLQLLVPTLGSACLFIFGNFRPQLLKPLCNTRHANTPICASKSDCNANTCIRSQVAAAPATVQSACIAR